MANRFGSVWYDPTAERGRGRWPDQERETAATGISRALERIEGAAGRTVVRTYDERIWVSAAPYPGGLPSRGEHGADEATRAGITVRIAPPEPVTDRSSHKPEYRLLVEVRSWFQRLGMEHPIPFAEHMAKAMEAMRQLGLTPREDPETSDECRYDVRSRNLARDVAAIIGAYLAVPFRRVGPDDNPRVAPAATIEECQEVRMKIRRRVRDVLGPS